MWLVVGSFYHYCEKLAKVVACMIIFIACCHLEGGSRVKALSDLSQHDCSPFSDLHTTLPGKFF